MTKIDKTDIENINLIIKETKIKKVSKIKLKKNNYEIEITTNDFNSTNQNLKQIETLPEKKESPTKTEIENDENIDDEVEMSGIITFIKEKFEDSPSYKENKKGFLFILSTEAGKFPIFIDDLGLIFRLEVENSTEVFDTENYIKK